MKYYVTFDQVGNFFLINKLYFLSHSKIEQKVESSCIPPLGR